MGAVRWLVIGMLVSGCAHEDEDPRIGAVRASLGKAQATIADASALLEAESPTALDQMVVVGNVPRLLFDLDAPEAIDPRAQGAVTTRSLIDWSTAFATTDGIMLLDGPGGVPAVATQARVLAHTALRIAASPQTAAPLVRMRLAEIGYALAEVHCLASSPDAEAPILTTKCEIETGFSLVLEAAVGLETSTHSLETLVATRAAQLVALGDAVTMTRGIALQAQAPVKIINSLTSLDALMQELEKQQLSASQRVLALRSAQQAATIELTSLTEGTVEVVLGITAQIAAADADAGRDAMTGILIGLNQAFVETDNAAGIACTGADGFACIAQQLTGTWLSLDAAVVDSEATNSTQATMAISLLPSGGQYDALLDAGVMLDELQMSFNLQYLQLQSQMQHESRSYGVITSIMKTKHDTVSNSVSNVR